VVGRCRHGIADRGDPAGRGLAHDRQRALS
jgi:hypothetical protein